MYMYEMRSGFIVLLQGNESENLMGKLIWRMINNFTEFEMIHQVRS